MPIKKLIIYTDGGARGNPGPAALGVVFKNEKGESIKSYSEYIGETTNNTAEYQAVIFALQKAKHLFGKEATKKMELELRLDSELVASQLNGTYKVEEGRLQILFMKIWNLKFDFGKMNFISIRREENKEADRLVNEVLDRKQAGLF